MILVADSGSTKTQWASVGIDVLPPITTMGLNPLLVNDDSLLRTFADVRDTLCVDESCEEVWFYGAGCGSERSQMRVVHLIATVFPKARVSVCGDLLGACRAACGNNPGLVGILGTGSNLCLYDGTRIARQRPSTGYLLGDEGSGNHIGRCLLKDYLELRMPADISTMFHGTYMLDYDECIDRLYHRPNVNRFLASLAPFAARHIQEPYVERLVANCFDAFFRLMDDYAEGDTLPLHLVGGLTSDFSRPLREAAARHRRTVASFIPDPLPGLIRYHRDQ